MPRSLRNITNLAYHVIANIKDIDKVAGERDAVNLFHIL
jgi:hypothetical protein